MKPRDPAKTITDQADVKMEQRFALTFAIPNQSCDVSRVLCVRSRASFLGGGKNIPFYLQRTSCAVATMAEAQFPQDYF